MLFIINEILFILSIALPYVYLILLVIGIIFCWRYSFKEGLFFFIIMLVYEGFSFYARANLIAYFTIVTGVEQILITTAFFLLVLGIYRQYKTDGQK